MDINNVKNNITLECSSVGDKRFSAFYAYIDLFGKRDSIENFYQNSKGFYHEPIKRKGSVPNFMILNGIRMDRDFLHRFYEFMWIVYFIQNPKLYDYACSYERFTDRFRSKNAIVCQADTIYKLVNRGLESCFSDSKMQEFCDMIKEFL